MGLLAAPTRWWLNAWGKLGKAPGLWYQAFERFGPRVAIGQLLDRRLPNGMIMHCDLADHVHRLSDYRGRKVFLVAWASW